MKNTFEDIFISGTIYGPSGEAKTVADIGSGGLLKAKSSLSSTSTLGAATLIADLVLNPASSTTYLVNAKIALTILATTAAPTIEITNDASTLVGLAGDASLLANVQKLINQSYGLQSGTFDVSSLSVGATYLLTLSALIQTVDTAAIRLLITGSDSGVRAEAGSIITAQAI